MEPTIKVDDVWEQIAALRASYENTIERADAMIAEANELKREARKGLDALPVAKTRRAKKSTVTVEGMTKVLTALGESLKDDEGDGETVTLPELRLPGAMEMFPHGIERTERGK